MTAEQIVQVRRFNRSVSKRIGALDDSFLDLGRPLSEARLLYEIGRRGAEVRELRARLGLDSGYLSRLLRSLERQGLSEALSAPSDGRVRRVKLSLKGLREVAKLDRRSDKFAKSLLAPLTGRQRSRLVEAMTEVERLMQASAVSIEVEPPTIPEAHLCLEAFFEELARRFESGFDPAKSLSASVGELVPPSGALVLARLDGVAVGCGALRKKGQSIGEIKHLWVDETARGMGVGRRILEKLESLASDFGLRTVQLDTNRGLTEAQALYRSSGYREVAPSNEEPYADYWFEKRLSPEPNETDRHKQGED